MKFHRSTTGSGPLRFDDGFHHLLPGGIDQGDRNRFFENATYSCYPRWIPVLRDFWITLKAHSKGTLFISARNPWRAPRSPDLGCLPNFHRAHGQQRVISASSAGLGSFCRRVIFRGGRSGFTRICGGTLLTVQDLAVENLFK